MTDKRTSFEQSQEGRTSVPSRLSESEFYRALAAAERRRLLQLLLDGERHAVDDVADALRDDADTGFRLKLRHVHLPVLAESGLVDYDQDRRTVRLASLDPFVEEIIRWSVDADQGPLP